MSLLPTTAEIAQMRVDLEAVGLPDTCTILSLSRTSDGQGGWSETWGTATASVACRVDAKGGRKAVTADALLPYSSWVLTVPQAATLTTDHRVAHGGITYNVISVNIDASWPLCKRAMLEAVP